MHPSPAALSGGRMASCAIARIDLCAVGIVTQGAPLPDALVRRADMERLGPPVGVTTGRRTGLQRIGGSRLFVGIVAHAALLAMRVARRIEVGELGAHFMAAETFVRAGAERSSGGIARRKQRHLRRERMAGDAMEFRLTRHLAQADLRADVAACLPAGRVHRHEAVHLETVARGALHIAERARIRLEVHAVPRGCCDALPLFLLFVTLDVAAGADASRHLGMHLDFFGAIGDPQVQLPRARENRLLVTAMAAQGIVLGPGESLKRALHDMAAGAETVVVLHVIPADGAESRRADRRDGGGCGETDLDAALARFDPRGDLDATAPHVYQEPRGDGHPDEEAADLEPLRQVEEETQHRSHPARQRRRANRGLL